MKCKLSYQQVHLTAKYALLHVVSDALQRNSIYVMHCKQVDPRYTHCMPAKTLGFIQVMNPIIVTGFYSTWMCMFQILQHVRVTEIVAVWLRCGWETNDQLKIIVQTMTFPSICLISNLICVVCYRCLDTTEGHWSVVKAHFASFF